MVNDIRSCEPFLRQAFVHQKPLNSGARAPQHRLSFRRARKALSFTAQTRATAFLISLLSHPFIAPSTYDDIKLTMLLSTRFAFMHKCGTKEMFHTRISTFINSLSPEIT
jgi:hypothetical protein